MTNQLLLIDTQPDWRLDEKTRRVGRQGIADARAALTASLRARSGGPPAAADPPPAGRRVATAEAAEGTEVAEVAAVAMVSTVAADAMAERARRVAARARPGTGTRPRPHRRPARPAA